MLLPEHDFLASPATRDQLPVAAVAKAIVLLVDPVVDVADADLHRLGAMQVPAEGVLAVPRKGVGLFRLGRELHFDAAAGDKNLEVDSLEAGRQLLAGHGNADRARRDRA